MASVVEICNRALSKLGQRAITSLDDGIKTANQCKSTYPFVSQAVARSHPWSCLRHRVRLGPLASTPAFGYKNEYKLPTNCLRVVSLVNIHRDQPYEIEGRKILIDQDTYLDLRYIRRPDDPQEFDALLTDLIATTLAFEICESLTNSTSKKDKLEDEATAKNLMAKQVNGLEDPHFEFTEDDWVVARA